MGIEANSPRRSLPAAQDRAAGDDDANDATVRASFGAEVDSATESAGAGDFRNAATAGEIAFSPTVRRDFAAAVCSCVLTAPRRADPFEARPIVCDAALTAVCALLEPADPVAGRRRTFTPRPAVISTCAGFFHQGNRPRPRDDACAE